jgi:fumarate reductase flavoprotein subunit
MVLLVACDDGETPYAAPGGGTAADSAETGADTADTAVEVEATWDVVVVGSGPAGMAAALSAREAGASVVVLERAASAGQGIVTAGQCFAVGTRWQAAEGVEDSVAVAAAEWETLTGEPGDGEGVAAFLEASADTLEWLDAYGEAVEGVFADGDAGSVARLHGLDVHGGGDPALVTAFDGDLTLDAEVTAPILDGDGGVAGVWWTDADGTEHAVGAGAVVLATGGFVRDLDLVEGWAPGLAGRELLFEANYGSDGGGVPFLEAAGAAWAAPEDIGVYLHSTQDPEFRAGEAMIGGGLDGGIIVGADGARFADEGLLTSLDFFDLAPEDAWAVLDAEGASRVLLNRPQYNWADPDLPETLGLPDALGAGDVFSSELLGELAEEAGIDSTGLTEAVDDFNDAVTTGAGDPYGRDLTDAEPIGAGPYWAVHLYPGVAKNFGGVATSVSGEVLDADGVAIPGLYAAGEVAGMILGGGAGDGFSGSVCACYQGGREAGGNAAAYAGAIGH